MIKSVRILAVAAAASLLAAPCALAERVVVKADIPFDFVVAGRLIPSGEYVFVVTDDPGLVQIRSASSGAHFAAVPCSPLTRDARGATRVVFDRHGSEQFLKTIHSWDGSGVYLAETPAERQAEARAEAAAQAAAQARAAGGGAAKTSLP
jgi:hypothetical protein